MLSPQSKSLVPWSIACALLLAACASTTVDGTWTRAEFGGTRIDGPILVVGVARDETVRRTYEDDMVAKLAARGLTALRSYEGVAGTLDRDSHEKLLAAARGAGARYLLSTAVIGREREQVLRQDPWPYAGFAGYRGWYGAYWGMSWPVRTEVRSYDVYLAETALTSVANDRVEWTVRTRTSSPTNIERETRAFVDVILNAMARGGLIPAAG
jgi:hypothetical protein